MGISKVLFYLGLAIAIVGFVGNAVAVIMMTSQSLTLGPNINFTVNSLLGPLWQGGSLIGIAKILEAIVKRGSGLSLMESGSEQL